MKKVLIIMTLFMAVLAANAQNTTPQTKKVAHAAAITEKKDAAPAAKPSTIPAASKPAVKSATTPAEKPAVKPAVKKAPKKK